MQDGGRHSPFCDRRAQGGAAGAPAGGVRGMRTRPRSAGAKSARGARLRARAGLTPTHTAGGGPARP
jgi:hypothetical protein